MLLSISQHLAQLPQRIATLPNATSAAIEKPWSRGLHSPGQSEGEPGSLSDCVEHSSPGLQGTRLETGNVFLNHCDLGDYLLEQLAHVD